VLYSARGVISPVYLLDAPVELGLVLGWSVVWTRQRSATP
jgi:hypothetical protein